VDNQAATVLVAVLAVPGVQRLLEAVAVRIESRVKRDSCEPERQQAEGGEGRNVPNES